jgi:hypothetical protein
MAPFTSDLRLVVWWRDLLTGVDGGAWGLNFSRYGSSDLVSRDRFWIFSHGCRDEDCPRSFCANYYVSQWWFVLSNLQWSQPCCSAVFPSIVVLILLLVVIDYFNDCACARSPIAAQIKIMKKSLFVFTSLLFCFLVLPSKDYRIVSWKKKEFEVSRRFALFF